MKIINVLIVGLVQNFEVFMIELIIGTINIFLFVCCCRCCCCCRCRRG